MFDLKKLCYFLVAINVLVIFFNLTFIRNVDPQQGSFALVFFFSNNHSEIEVMGSSENKGPNIDIDISKSAIKPKPIDKNAPYISVDFEITGKVQGNNNFLIFFIQPYHLRSLLQKVYRTKSH